MTVEECLFACKDAGYALAGLEYAVSELKIKLHCLSRPLYKLSCSRVNVSVELYSVMALRRSPAACATCHAMVMQTRRAEDLPF
jgi:hypothetical protein